MNTLQGSNRFFARVNVAKTNRVEFEDRRAKNSQEQNRNEDFREGHRGACCPGLQSHCLLDAKISRDYAHFLFPARNTRMNEKIYNYSHN